MTADQGHLDVCLVSMPFAPLPQPGLGLGLLHALLADGGLATVTRHPNLRFAERIGMERLRLLMQTRTEDLAFEWVFRHAAFDVPVTGQGALDFATRLIRRTPPLAGRDAAELAEVLMDLAGQAFDFVDETARDIVARAPRIVGCSSTFQQHVGSLALLRRLRALAPGIVTMIGGANCETRMGRATHRLFPWVDIVVSGEADRLIVPLVRSVLTGGADLDPALLADGVFVPAHRATGYPAWTAGDGVPRATTTEMSDLPPPDYRDFFNSLELSPLRDHILPSLSYESSRGCWWGERHHCTFCGLNGTSMQYRAKPHLTVLADMALLYERHKIRNLQFVDNILPLDYFDSLFPALAQTPHPFHLFYETKANLNPPQVVALKAAGVTQVQPGIESLITPVLRLMDKGTTALRNIAMLKLARQSGLDVLWTNIVGTPGEVDDWYGQAARWLPLVSHLQPGGLTRLRFDRYSLYHADPGRYGLRLVPSEMYEPVYGLARADLDELAYYFESEGAPDAARNLIEQDLSATPGLDSFRRALLAWTRLWEGRAPILQSIDIADSLMITDTRPAAVQPFWVATGLARAILQVAVMPQMLADIARKVGLDASDPAFRAVYDDLVRRGLVLEGDDGPVIGLVLVGPVPDLPPLALRPLGLLLAEADAELRRQVVA